MQALNETKNKGISLKTASVLMVLVSEIIAVALLVTGTRAFRSFADMRKSSENYISLTEAASDLMDASDYLTEEVQRFTVMGDRKHMVNYFTEANVTRRRDRGLAVLEVQAPGSEALERLEKSMAESVSLMDREYYAMRLVLEAQGDNDKPEEVKNMELSEADSALSAEEKTMLAQQMVHDSAYYEQKDRIRGNMTECLTALDNSTRQTQQEMEARAYRDLKWVMALVLLQTAAIFAMWRITTRLGMNPIIKAVGRIRKNQEIPVAGSAEFRYLAETYNSVVNAHKKSIHKASHDELTGAYNRAGYELIRSGLDTKTTAMLLFDADGFKNINDRFGHETGDKVLRKIADVLKNNFRSGDYICRIGGDEFVVFMVNISRESAKLIESKAAKINQCLGDDSDGLPPVTLSAGVSYDPEGNEPDEMFRQADTALYHVKENGRNGCCFYTDQLS